jgi:hypothetical protein
MLSPLVICNGIIRSGSTWSYNVCRLLTHLHASRRSDEFYGGFVDGPAFEDFLKNNVYILRGAGVFKTHATGPLAAEWVRTGRAKAVCTCRDPRDCVASDVVFMNQGFDRSVQRVVASLQSLDVRSDFGRTLFVRYEEMMNSRADHIRLIAAYLNIPIDSATIDAIDRQTNLESTRKLVAQIPTLGPDVAPTLANVDHRRHIETLLHENHIGSAKPGRWKTDLTESQSRYLTHIFSNFLIAFGYETPESIQANLPRGEKSPNFHMPQPPVAKKSA